MACYWQFLWCQVQEGFFLEKVMYKRLHRRMV